MNAAKLATLREQVQTLNLASDAVSEILAEAEEKLTGVGVEAVLPRTASGVQIGYSKFDDGWHISFATVNNPRLTKIRNASRAIRIVAVESLDALVEALSEQTVALIARAAAVAKEKDQ